jgi:hypothetical protein
MLTLDAHYARRWRVDQIAPQPAQPRQRPLLIGASKLAVPDHIGRKNGCEFPLFGHGGVAFAFAVMDESLRWSWQIIHDL